MRFLTTCLLAACLTAPAAGFARAADDKPATPAAAAGKDRFFEMRTYVAAEGKFEALQSRFRDHTNGLFRKHGIEVVGYWVPTDPKMKDTLVYILVFPNKEAREAAWKAFGTDPEWKKALAESEKDGKLTKKVESVYMTPTDYSPMK
jgi:hypothetical protein